ncbi:hypothetical protein [Streptomyces vinaceus]|uniref:hypothetical protein n=1 Tax=Streptomyces vinaceus TaxID=1960 RepID=UPI0036781181
MSKTLRGKFCFGGAFPVAPVEVVGLTSAPELFTNYQRMISRDGMWKGTQYLGGRSITLSMNILASENESINTIVNELSWAFPIGYGTNQEEIELHFNIPGIANGAAAYLKGMVQKRDIKLDKQYAQHGAARIDVELYCNNPSMFGYGRAQARMDTAAGFFNGGAPAPFVFTDSGLDFPANWAPGVEQKVLVTNSAKDTDANNKQVGPHWEAKIFGPVNDPKLVRRNYFEDIWSIGLKGQYANFYLREGQSLIYQQVKQDPATSENPIQPFTYMKKVWWVGGEGTKPIDITEHTYTTKPGVEDDKAGEFWKDVGTLRTSPKQIATSEYWSILPGQSKSPIGGNSHGTVEWWGGEFI